jgi:hypothetical protein
MRPRAALRLGWPHPQYLEPMPSNVALLEMMLMTDERTRQLVLVDNPAELFGFP